MPRNLNINLVEGDNESSLTVVHEGKTHVATDSHPAWERIRDGALADDPSIIDLFDASKTIARQILSERVSAANGRLYFDGDEIHGALADLIIRVVDEGRNASGLVAYLENVKENPDPTSVEQLYRFVKDAHITITDTGMLVAYKGVHNADEKGVYSSVHSGFALVNGVPVDGKIKQRVGDVVEMPRSMVVNDPSNGCSVGLHVATFSFAKGFAGSGTVLEVLVNPRDVVSVPSYEVSKVRVCRYKITRVLDGPHDRAIIKDASVKTPEPAKAPEPQVQAPELSAHAVTAHAEPGGIDRKPKKGGDNDMPTATTASRGRIPSSAELETMVTTAKRQKTGLVRYLTKRGWSLVSGDGSRPSNWRKPSVAKRSR